MYCKELDCETRFDYFESLAETYGVEIEVVETLAETLGSDEDFDGLVSMIEDLGGF